MNWPPSGLAHLAGAQGRADQALPSRRTRAGSGSTHRGSINLGEKVKSEGRERKINISVDSKSSRKTHVSQVLSEKT